MVPLKRLHQEPGVKRPKSLTGVAHVDLRMDRNYEKHRADWVTM